MAAPDTLTADELRTRLDARTQDIQRHLKGLQHELTTVADVTVAGRPVLDHVRAHPLKAAGWALAAGAALGLLTGLRARSKRRPAPDDRFELIQLYTARVLESAADFVARGRDPEEALDLTLKKHPPVVYYAPEQPSSRSTFRETFDVAVKTALGFGVKAGLDRLTLRLTGEDDVIEAAADPPTTGTAL